MSTETVSLDRERDAALVASAKAGCASAFEELHRLHAPRLFRTAIRILKSHEDTEDVLQNAFLRAFRALDSFEGRASFATWMQSITVNSALMCLRKRHRSRECQFAQVSCDGDEYTFDVPDHAPDAEQILSAQRDQAHLARSIKKLNPRLRKVVELQIHEDVSNREIARRLGITVFAAKSRRHRAWKRLIEARNLRERQGLLARTNRGHRAQAN